MEEAAGGLQGPPSFPTSTPLRASRGAWVWLVRKWKGLVSMRRQCGTSASPMSNSAQSAALTPLNKVRVSPLAPGGRGWALCLLLCLVGLAGRVQALTELPDTLRPAQGHVFRLSEFSGPFWVNQRSVVLPGDTLVAGPGDTLLFRADSLGLGSLFIQGTLLAEGNSDSLVVFDGMPGNQYTWPGLYFNLLAPDSSTSRLRHTHINGANTSINSNRVAAFGQSYSLVVQRSLITDGSFGAVLFNHSSSLFENCVFDDHRNVCVYASSSLAEVVNCVLMPHEEYRYEKAITFYNPVRDPVTCSRYNLFDPGPEGVWNDLLLSNVTGDSQYTYHVPDSTNLIESPVFLPDQPYHPDPDFSPLVDAGDPTIMDPDGTVSDIGIWWVQGILAPFRIHTAPDPSIWVAGYSYQASFEIEAFPPPTWSLAGAPAGMQVLPQGRTRAALSWPASQQLAGEHHFWIHGQNVINEIPYHDSLEVNLTFLVNRPPLLSLVSPCDEGDCLGQQNVVVESHSAGTSTRLTLMVEDPDADLLGIYQTYRLDSWLNGVREEISYTNFYDREVILDTTWVVLDLRFSDGLASDSLHLEIRPRFSLLSGDVSGSIGSSTGAVFLVGSLRVPPGQTLRVEAGSQVVAGPMGVDDWLLDVEGVLNLEGTAEDPITFRSLAPRGPLDDQRPPFLRVQSGGQVGRIAHVNFQGFSTALQFEHLDPTEPVQVDSCTFLNVRLGVLAVNTPVDIRHCEFDFPADSAQQGSSSIYLAESQGSTIQNNLFLNPIVGVTCVDSDALIANNSFMWVRTRDPRTLQYYWPVGSQLGFGRVHAFNSTLDVRNNLFQWRGNHGNYLDDAHMPAYIASSVHAVWVDEESQVRADWNWFDCRNGWLLGEEGYTNVGFMSAFNDSTRLLSHIRAGADTAKVDENSNYRLFADSPLVNAGDPAALWADGFDGSRCDIGWTGGPLAVENEYTAVNSLPHEEPLPVILPGGFRLGPAYPNPFNPVAHLEVELDRAGLLDVRVYDLLGRQVAVLLRDQLEPGTYRLRVDGSAWASGLYVARARLGEQQRSTRLLLVK